MTFHKHLAILFLDIKDQYLTILSTVFTKSKNGPSFSLKLKITQRHLHLQIKIVKILWFYLVNSKKILTSKRLRGFSNPSQYSMTLSKRFEWHWSHEWSTKLETILLLEYCGRLTWTHSRSFFFLNACDCINCFLLWKYLILWHRQTKLKFIRFLWKISKIHFIDGVVISAILSNLILISKSCWKKIWWNHLKKSSNISELISMNNFENVNIALSIETCIQIVGFWQSKFHEIIWKYIILP